jgi:hypothetical protein
LREDSLKSLAGKSISRVLRELLPGELEIVVIVQLPEADVYDIEVLVAEEVGIEVDVWFGFNVK